MEPDFLTNNAFINHFINQQRRRCPARGGGSPQEPGPQELAKASATARPSRPPSLRPWPGPGGADRDPGPRARVSPAPDGASEIPRRRRPGGGGRSRWWGWWWWWGAVSGQPPARVADRGPTTPAGAGNPLCGEDPLRGREGGGSQFFFLGGGSHPPVPLPPPKAGGGGRGARARRRESPVWEACAAAGGLRRPCAAIPSRVFILMKRGTRSND